LGSLLHATALAELERAGVERGDGDNFLYEYNVISPDDLDEQSLECLRKSDTRVELLYTWILHHILDGVERGVLAVPPPVLTRAYQELASGLVHYHNAFKLALSPFPFLYVWTCDGLLLIHWLIAPVVTSQWATHWVWAALFSFIQVFVLILLTAIASALANPFGRDPNDVNGTAMQMDMNLLLSSMLAPGSERAPDMRGGWSRVAESAHASRSTDSLAQVLGVDTCMEATSTVAGREVAALRQVLSTIIHRVLSVPNGVTDAGEAAPDAVVESAAKAAARGGGTPDAQEHGASSAEALLRVLRSPPPPQPQGPTPQAAGAPEGSAQDHGGDRAENLIGLRALECAAEPPPKDGGKDAPPPDAVRVVESRPPTHGGTANGRISM